MLDSLIHLLVTKQYAPRQETKHPNETSHPLAMPGLAGSWFEVLTVFLRLGLTSFGGPVAHLGYFREEFVVRRRWLEDRSYADLVALCQFLPGPASSQVGLAIGLSRAGYPGAFAAWAGFTLPSAVALVVFGYGLRAFGDVTGAGWLHGLKVVAVAVVAQAVLGMMQSLVPDRERATVAVLSALIMLAIPNSWGQIAAIAMGAGAGATLTRTHADRPCGFAAEGEPSNGIHHAGNLFCAPDRPSLACIDNIVAGVKAFRRVLSRWVARIRRRTMSSCRCCRRPLFLRAG